MHNLFSDFRDFLFEKEVEQNGNEKNVQDNQSDQKHNSGRQVVALNAPVDRVKQNHIQKT